MKLKIKKINTLKANYWDNLVISMVWLYDNDDKWIKWVKLDDKLIETLSNNYIEVDNY